MFNMLIGSKQKESNIFDLLDKKNNTPQLSERKLKNQYDILNPIKESKEDNVYHLIDSLFKNKLKKDEFIIKHRPFFSLKVIPQMDIDKIYSSLDTIPADKIKLVEDFKYKEEKFESKNLYETYSKSLGLSNLNVDLSLNIFGNEQKAEYHRNEDNLNMNSNTKGKLYCIHSIFISLFRTSIDSKDIQLSKTVYEELKDIEKGHVTEKKQLLKKFIDKFGLYIPSELVFGGRMNICFEAKNEEEKNIYQSYIQNKIDVKLGAKIFCVSGKLGLDYNKNNRDENFSQSLNNTNNMTTKIIGGNYLFRNDLINWIKSFNIDNLQVIEYKALKPIYNFIPGLESKLKVCLSSYNDIVLQQINDLIENDFKNTEENLYEGSSINSNSWKVGIIKDYYYSFNILKDKVRMKIIITKNINYKRKLEKKEKKINYNIIYDCDDLYLCGEIPEGCIICGWELSTNVNSKPYNIICTWKRKKELRILGSKIFKFKLDIDLSAVKKFDKDIEIDWVLNYFYIGDYLFNIGRPKNNFNNCDENKKDNPNEIYIFLQNEYKINNILPSTNENFNILSNNIKENIVNSTQSKDNNEQQQKNEFNMINEYKKQSKNNEQYYLNNYEYANNSFNLYHSNSAFFENIGIPFNNKKNKKK